MYAMYVFISVTLLFIGVVSSVYFLRFLKNRNLQNITVPALSESLNTLFIGIFYLYCAIVMAQHVINPSVTSIDNEDDIIIMEEGGDQVAEYYEEKTTTESSVDLSTIAHVQLETHPNQQFLKNYYAFLENAIRVSTIKKQEQAQKNDEMEMPNEGNMNFTHIPTNEECFEEMVMENSMFLYSFLHSVIALLISTAKSENPADKSQKSDQNSESNDEKKSKTSRSIKRQKTECDKCKLIAKILVIFLIPVSTIVVFYFVMDHEMESNLNLELIDPNTVNSNLWDIIRKPINISTPEKMQEINDVVNNIYTIVNATRENPPPTSEIYSVNTRRRPKQLETCPPKTTYRVYVLLVFLIYFGTILYAKIREMQMRNNDAKAAKQLNISIVSFALLWVSSVFEMLSKTYLLEIYTSSILTEIFLSLGNFHQLSIIGMNYLTTKRTMKKYNLVEPQA